MSVALQNVCFPETGSFDPAQIGWVPGPGLAALFGFAATGGPSARVDMLASRGSHSQSRQTQDVSSPSPSVSTPVPHHYRDSALKTRPLTTRSELQVELETFFRHLETSCLYFRGASNEVYLEQVRSSLLGIFTEISDPVHIDYLAKALDFMKVNFFASPTQFGILPRVCDVDAEAEAMASGAIFLPGESHASRAAAVIDHLVRQSKYLFQRLTTRELEQVLLSLLAYAGDSGPINAALLQGETKAADQGQPVANLLATMFQDPQFPGLKGPFTLYRGIGSPMWENQSPAPDTVSRATIHSTTVDPKTMQDFGSKAKWLIQVPAGSEAKVFSLAQWSLKKENELVLGPTRLERLKGLQETEQLERLHRIAVYRIA